MQAGKQMVPSCELLGTPEDISASEDLLRDVQFSVIKQYNEDIKGYYCVLVFGQSMRYWSTSPKLCNKIAQGIGQGIQGICN